MALALKAGGSKSDQAPWSKKTKCSRAATQIQTSLMFACWHNASLAVAQGHVGCWVIDGLMADIAIR